MALPLASEALDEARFLLNDVGAKVFTNAILLPALKKSYRELRQAAADNGISVTREASDEIEIPQGNTVITFGATPPDPTLPDDLLYPIRLDEKFQNEDDTEYREMTETVWRPDQVASDRLQFWCWQEDEIKTPPASGITVVRIKYWKDLTALEDEDSEIAFLDSITFLAARTAALAAFSLGGSPTKASAFNEDAEKALNIFLSTSVKNRQALPVRRKPFRRYRWGYGVFWR